MIEKKHVVIALAKCCHERSSFGIRFEEKDHHLWVGNWAFPIVESTAKREMYDKNKISGSITFDSEYPGCPYCRSPGIFQCGKCSKIGCYNGKQETVVCPWCNTKSLLKGRIESLDAGMDR